MPRGKKTNTVKKQSARPAGGSRGKLLTERENELTSIWGGHVLAKSGKAADPEKWGPDAVNDEFTSASDATAVRVPTRVKRRMEAKEKRDEEILSDGEEEEGDAGKRTRNALHMKKKKGNDKLGETEANTAKKKAVQDKKKRLAAMYKLHCFVAPGTQRNDVRELFDDYEPKVTMKTSQKGNVLNKTHYATVTFMNKALGLHAVQKFQGTDQMNTIGVRKCELGIMRSRRQNKNRKGHQKPGNAWKTQPLLGPGGKVPKVRA